MTRPRNWLVYSIGAILVCVFLAGAVFAYLAYVASQAVPTRPLVRITETIPEGVGVASQPVVVFAQASDPDGIAEVALWVNGQRAGSQTNPDQNSLLSFETSQAWIPNGAGNYLIVLRATDRKGFVGDSDPLAIQVQERAYEPDPGLEGENEAQEGETSGDAADAPPDTGAEEVARIDPPLPAPPPGGEAEAEPSPAPFWTLLPLPEGFFCLINPELCAPTGGLEPPPFPAPGGVGFAEGEGCSIDVSWTDNSENEDGFRIYRFVSRPRFRLDLVEIVGAASGIGTRLNYQDTSPPRGTFFYAIVAYNAGGDTWSGPSDTVESEGCPPSGPIVVQALVVEGLEMNVAGSYDRLYCYASLADSPFERIPHGTSSFINLESGSWNIAEHFSGVNKREVMASAVDPLNIVVECMGWQGDELINLGRFARSHPPEEWDGRSLVAGPESGGFSVTYRINFSFHAADEGGRASFPLIDSSLPAPFNLRTADDFSDCRVAPDRRGPCGRTVLEWDYTPSEGAPRFPTAYKVYSRSPGGPVPILYHTTLTSLRSAPLATDDCNETVFYSVSAVVGNDPVTGEEIQSPLSEELEVPPSCASLEITLETLGLVEAFDGRLCTEIPCGDYYEAYGWLDFNGHRILWNDHCDTSFFEFTGCIYVGPSYTEVGRGVHNFSAMTLNIGDGWHRNNNIIRIPIEDGELAFTFTFMDHDVHSEDHSFCGNTGRPQIVAAARSAPEWLTFNQVLEAQDGDCFISIRVRGMPGLP